MGLWKKTGAVYECPSPGCNKTTPNPQGMAAHVRTTHPELWRRMHHGADNGSTAGENGSAKPAGSSATGQANAAAAAPGDPAPAPDAQAEADAVLMQIITGPKISAAAACTDILALPTVQGMTADALEKLMLHVVAIKRIDDNTYGISDLSITAEGTGFTTPPVLRDRIRRLDTAAAEA